jgi:hypothetical protein
VSELFDGEARPLPVSAGDRGVLGFGYSDPSTAYRAPAPVRHAAGYGPFVAFVTATGDDPVVLARDLGAFGAFVRARREELTEPALAEAASVFLGNLLVVVHPRASWRMTPDPEVGTGAVSMPVRDALASMRDEPGFAARTAAELPARWAEADARHDEVEAGMAAARAASDAAVLAEVPELVAPLVPVGPFLDEQGEPIPYGDRWDPADGAPQDAYSRVTHPERFAPLIEAAEALIAHLERFYDVDVTWSSGGERTATLHPGHGAPIRLRFTDFPAVRLQVGLLLDETLPSCGCDACDEVAETEAEKLVETVLGVAAGGYAERLLGPAGPGATSLRFADGGGSGSGGAPVPEASERLVEPEEVAALEGAAWPAWPRRR